MIGTLAAAILSPSLFFFHEADRKCAWNVFETASRETRTVLETPTCPEQLIWDARSRRSWYSVEGKIFALDWGKPESATFRARLPIPRVERLWLSKGAGGLRAAYLAPLDKAADVVYRGRHIFFRFEGQLLDATDLEDRGLPRIAVAMELQDDGRWRRLAARPTRGISSDAPGLSVLDDLLAEAEGSRRLDELLLQGSCARRACSLNGLKNDGKLGRTLGISGEDQPAYAPLGRRGGLLFVKAQGDAPHAGPPVFFCRSRCEQMFPLKEITDGQLGISIQDGYALVASEYYGRKLRLYEESGPAPILAVDDSSSAVWLPFPGSCL